MKSVKEMLDNKARQYKGPAISPHILADTVKIYTETTRRDKDYGVQSRNRGRNREQQIAVILYNRCIAHGTFRSREEIAKFMCSSAQFAHGDQFVNKIQMAGKMDILAEETPTVIAIRYMEHFEIPRDKIGFIEEVMQRAARCNINSPKRMVSKTVALVWYLIMRLRLPVTIADYVAIVGIKANTLTEFLDDIICTKHFFAFYHLHEKYGVPLV